MGKQFRHFGVVTAILPNEAQIVKLSQTFGCSRFVYNNYLAARNEHYKMTGENLSVARYRASYLNPSKKTEEFSFLKDVDKYLTSNT